MAFRRVGRVWASICGGCERCASKIGREARLGAAVGAVVPPRRCGIGGEFMRMAAAPLYTGMNYDHVSDLWPDGPAVFFVLVGILVNQVALSQPNSWMDRLEDKVDWVNRLIHSEVREMLKRNTR